LQNSAEMYSAADYVEMLIIFGECGRNAREAARIFSDRFPDRHSPDHKTILRVLAKAQETGKVLPNRNEIGGSARTARTLANEEAILNIVEEDGTRSIREIAQELHRLHPFHYTSTRVQHLEPGDYPARKNVCVWLLKAADLVFERIKFWSAGMFQPSKFACLVVGLLIRVHFSVDFP
jgi:hypothetical protein